MCRLAEGPLDKARRRGSFRKTAASKGARTGARGLSVVSFSKLSASFALLGLVLAINSLYIYFRSVSDLVNDANGNNVWTSGNHHGRRTLATATTTSPNRCVVVAIMSHQDEHKVRQWHREQFNQYQSRFLKAADRRIVQLRFAVPTTNDKTTTSLLSLFRIGRETDVIHLNAPSSSSDQQQQQQQQRNSINKNENQEFTTAETLALLEEIEPTLASTSASCEHSFLLRAESRYVINYETLHFITTHPWLPTESTYFGSIVTHHPVPAAATDQTRNVLPTFAFGGVYGLSADMVRRLVDPTTKHGVWKPDEMASQDQAIGLALHKAGENPNGQRAVQNPVHVNGIYHQCSIADCGGNHYQTKNFLAFVVNADGMPEPNESSGKDQLAWTLQRLHECSHKANHLEARNAVRDSKLFFRVKHGSTVHTMEHLSESCPSSSSKAKSVLPETQRRSNVTFTSP